MVLDTGSELSWLHCKKLPNLNSTFNPLLSSSYTPTPCNSSICTTRTRDLTIPASCDPNNKLCHVIVSYADASSAEGTLAAETFSLAGAAQPGTLFGCMDSAGYTSDINEDSKTTGLMGMNRGSLSLVTQMSLPKFSYCISGEDALDERSADPNRGSEFRVRGGDGLTLVFSGAEMRVSGERLLYRVSKGSDWVYCFTFGNSDLLGIEAYVIGHHHQQNVWMEFDLLKSRVGFTQTTCDLATQRLGLSP
ncbi:Aspartic proteinase nepenthesin-1 [Glycine soja]|nr:Aspartic proteinase nepenthesin-1 [Glycine soja]